MSQQIEDIVEETKKQTERADGLRIAVSELTLEEIAIAYGNKNNSTEILLSAVRAWEQSAATCKANGDHANYEVCVRESLAYQESMDVLMKKQ